MLMQVCLYASDISSYLGQNKWSVVMSFERLLSKIAPKEWTSGLQKLENTKVKLEKDIKVLDAQLLSSTITKTQHATQIKQKTIQQTMCTQQTQKVNLSKEDYIVNTLGKETSEILHSDQSNIVKKKG